MQSGCRPPCCRLAKQVVTSRSFADRYVKNGEVVTHSHGPQGMHSHGLIDFNTWMDPQQAALQAQAIHDELVRLVPDAAKEFDANLEALEKGPGGSRWAVGRRLGAARQGAAPGFASRCTNTPRGVTAGTCRPSIGSPMKCPPRPNGRNWRRCTPSIRPRLMIWEEDPLPAVATRLRGWASSRWPSRPAPTRRPSGDYLSAMKANAKRFGAALKKTK